MDRRLDPESFMCDASDRRVSREDEAAEVRDRADVFDVLDLRDELDTKERADESCSDSVVIPGLGGFGAKTVVIQGRFSIFGLLWPGTYGPYGLAAVMAGGGTLALKVCVGSNG